MPRICSKKYFLEKKPRLRFFVLRDKRDLVYLQKESSMSASGDVQINKRTFWAKAKEGDDHILLLLCCMLSAFLLSTIIHTGYVLREVTMEEEIELLMAYGFVFETILLAIVIFSFYYLVNQIQERD